MRAWLDDLRFILSLAAPTWWRAEWTGCTCHPDHLDLGCFDRGCPTHDSSVTEQIGATR